MASTNLEKIDMVLMYGEAFGHSELAQKIYGERILPNARTFINVVQHLRDFGRFEKNKRDLPQQRGDRILVARRTKLKATNKCSASCKSPGSFSVCSLVFGCEFKTPLRKFVKIEAF
jgi:hypothetical protein